MKNEMQVLVEKYDTLFTEDEKQKLLNHPEFTHFNMLNKKIINKIKIRNVFVNEAKLQKIILLEVTRNHLEPNPTHLYLVNLSYSNKVSSINVENDNQLSLMMKSYFKFNSLNLGETIEENKIYAYGKFAYDFNDLGNIKNFEIVKDWMKGVIIKDEKVLAYEKKILNMTIQDVLN